MMIARAFRSSQIPTYDPFDDLTGDNASPFSPLDVNVILGSPDDANSLSSLQCYLPSNDVDSSDCFSCDEFRMYEFKVRRCSRGRSHDWTECPFAHPGEKARRRDPRKYHYSGTACPDFRRGICEKGDACEYAHGVFECWLHPARYRTQPCKDGTACRRRVCFFAHSPEQLRVVSPAESLSDGSVEPEFGSPVRRRRPFDAYLAKSVPESFVCSPTSILVSPAISPPSESPPVSPGGGGLLFGSFNPVHELAGSMRKLEVGGRVKMGGGGGSWGPTMGSGLRASRFMQWSGLRSMPTTPTRASGLCHLDTWDCALEEEPAIERVESGKELRAKMYARLSEENSLDRAASGSQAPDVGWVSELLR